jgi:hypothetical protein
MSKSQQAIAAGEFPFLDEDVTEPEPVVRSQDVEDEGP